jgi:predicted nucleic acid-binding protein
MIVISDTSPLNYLALIGVAGILHDLFGEVIVPGAVARELQADLTPPAARALIVSPPPWLLIRSPRAIDPMLPQRLGAGEQEAISLAVELKADLLLCDDEKARKSATQLAIRVMGTLGVVQLAGAKGLVDFSVCVNDLRRTTLRIPESLILEMLKEDAARKQKRDRDGD